MFRDAKGNMIFLQTSKEKTHLSNGMGFQNMWWVLIENNVCLHSSFPENWMNMEPLHGTFFSVLVTSS